jgi:hypothetical protein
MRRHYRNVRLDLLRYANDTSVDLRYLLSSFLPQILEGETSFLSNTVLRGHVSSALKALDLQLPRTKHCTPYIKVMLHVKHLIAKDCLSKSIKKILISTFHTNAIRKA